jgi:hypothetical protein
VQLAPKFAPANVVLVDTEVASSGVNATGLLAPFVMRRNLRRIDTVSDLDPFRYLLIAFDLESMPGHVQFFRQLGGKFVQQYRSILLFARRARPY